MHHLLKAAFVIRNSVLKMRIEQNVAAVGQLYQNAYLIRIAAAACPGPSVFRPSVTLVTIILSNSLVSEYLIAQWFKFFSYQTLWQNSNGGISYLRRLRENVCGMKNLRFTTSIDWRFGLVVFRWSRSNRYSTQDPVGFFVLRWVISDGIADLIIVTIWNVVFANKSRKLGWIWLKLGR